MRDGFESYREELDALRLTEDSKHALAESLSRRERRPARRRSSGWRRAALVTAVLAVVLAGTAVAAELAGVSVTDFFEGRGTDMDGNDYDYLGYDYYVNGIRLVPVESLAPGVLEHIEETRNSDGFYVINKAGFSREKAEEFLGLDLPDNPVLDQAVSDTMSFYKGDVAGETEDSLTYSRKAASSCQITLTGGGCGLQFIDVRFAYGFHHSEWTVEIEDGWTRGINFMPVYVTAHIYTDVNGEAIEADGTRSGLRIHQNEIFPVSAEGQESYTTPGGLETVIVKTSISSETSYKGGPNTLYDYRAYFVLEGIFYEMHGAFDDEAVALETMKQILDGFDQP